MAGLTCFDGPVWRLVPQDMAGTPALGARAPEGRFHHSGQFAVYASLSEEGAHVAIRRYIKHGPARVLVPMWLRASKVADERGNADASVVWQDIHDASGHSPTWEYSDAARAAGAHAMLYSSRSRPELSHVVAFTPSCLVKMP